MLHSQSILATKSQSYCKGQTGYNWVVHLVGCIDWLLVDRRNQHPEEGKQEELVAAVGSAVGSPAVGCIQPADPGIRAVAVHKMLVGSRSFGCN